MQAYKQFDVVDTSDWGHNCTYFWMGHDALDVVWKTYRFTTDLWENAGCSCKYRNVLSTILSLVASYVGVPVCALWVFKFASDKSLVIPR